MKKATTLILLFLLFGYVRAQVPDAPDTVQQKPSEPKIIYYQTTPDPKYKPTTRSRRQRNDIKTLAGSMNHSGGFGALSFRSTKFLDETMVLAGIRGGWIINRTLGIGLEGHGIIPTTKFGSVYPGEQVYALGGYGGMFLELIVFSNYVVHLTFPVSGGAGWIGYEQDWNSSDPLQPGDNNEDVFWYLEPGANIEVNIARNFRLDFGVSKRFTQDLNLENTSPDNFENINYYFTLKVGGF